MSRPCTGSIRGSSDGGVEVWLGGAGQDSGRATIEGGDVEVIGTKKVMIGMGERITPQAVSMLSRRLFAADQADEVLTVSLPKHRAYMHLDTVMTVVDRDAITAFPTVVDEARLWSVRPGDSAEDGVIERVDANLPTAMGRALGSTSMSSRRVATPSRRSGSRATTATTWWRSSRTSSWPTNGTPPPTPRFARPGSKSSRAPATSSDEGAAAATA
jgi:arginine deiminase